MNDMSLGSDALAVNEPVASRQTVERIRENGFCVEPKAFSQQEVARINQQLSHYVQQRHPGIVHEADSRLIRGVHGPHLYDPFFAELIRDPRLLLPAEALLEESCYVHQFKVNMKQRMNGQSWPWHQDYIYWRNGDGIPAPRLLNVAMLLNDVELLHGPLCFIPNSHREGDLSERPDASGSWEQDLSRDLTYQIGHEAIDRLIRNHGAVYITGRAGDLVFFDPLLAHCSSTNLSPQDRALLIVTYNAVSNIPAAWPPKARPEFLSSRDQRPL